MQKKRDSCPPREFVKSVQAAVANSRKRSALVLGPSVSDLARYDLAETHIVSVLYEGKAE